MSHATKKRPHKPAPGKCWCRGRPDILGHLNASEEENKQLRLLLRRAAGVLRDIHREGVQVPIVIREIEEKTS